MNAERFWISPGIVAQLEDLGWAVIAPDRSTAPESWFAAADEMASLIKAPSTIVAGSNGVSVALRLAVQHPALVARLLLLWPATAGDPKVDRTIPSAAARLLDGDTIRGVTDNELSHLSLPVSVMASSSENPHHQHRTVDRLVGTIPGATRISAAFPSRRALTSRPTSTASSRQ